MRLLIGFMSRRILDTCWYFIYDSIIRDTHFHSLFSIKEANREISSLIYWQIKWTINHPRSDRGLRDPRREKMCKLIKTEENFDHHFFLLWIYSETLFTICKKIWKNYHVWKTNLLLKLSLFLIKLMYWIFDFNLTVWGHAPPS